MATIESVKKSKTEEIDQSVRIGIKISRTTYNRFKHLAKKDRRYRDFIILTATLKLEFLINSAWNRGKLKPLSALVWEEKNAASKPALEEDYGDLTEEDLDDEGEEGD